MVSQGDPMRKDGVDHTSAKGLQSLTTDVLAKAMQSTSDNILVGTEGRATLLHSLGSSLLKSPEIFGANGRPGNLVGKILPHIASSAC